MKCPLRWTSHCRSAKPVPGISPTSCTSRERAGRSGTSTSPTGCPASLPGACSVTPPRCPPGSGWIIACTPLARCRRAGPGRPAGPGLPPRQRVRQSGNESEILDDRALHIVVLCVVDTCVEVEEGRAYIDRVVVFEVVERKEVVAGKDVHGVGGASVAPQRVPIGKFEGGLRLEVYRTEPLLFEHHICYLLDVI